MEFGFTWWMPLPGTKHIGPGNWAPCTADLYKPFCPCDAPPNAYINTFYGYFYLNGITTNKKLAGYDYVADGWHQWRRDAVVALAAWDGDNDGQITIAEVAHRSAGLLDLTWLVSADPCLLVNGAISANASYHYLATMDALFEAGADMITVGPRQVVAFPLETDTERCRTTWNHESPEEIRLASRGCHGVGPESEQRCAWRNAINSDKTSFFPNGQTSACDCEFCGPFAWSQVLD